MDYSAWRDHIETLTAMLRSPDAADLPTILFDRRADWYTEDAMWIIGRVSPWLSGHQAERLLALLRSGDPVSLRTAVDELRMCVATLQGAAPTSETPELQGYENVNWVGDCVPGTFYYTLDGEEYLYSDRERAPRTEWRTLTERQINARVNATAWTNGWWYTPTYGETARYNGDFVYAMGADAPTGPWMTRVQAEELIAAQVASQPQRLKDSIWQHTVAGHVRYGLSDSGPWMFTSLEHAESESTIISEVTESVMNELALPAVDHIGQEPRIRAMVTKIVLETAASSASTGTNEGANP